MTEAETLELEKPMTTATVSLAENQHEHDAAFGPAMIEHRTATSGLTQLGTYFMVFHSDEPGEPWTLHYEETMYVIEGELRLAVLEAAGERIVSAPAGDVVVLPKGSTVRYGAAIGTRLLLSISPVNWRDA
jgi:ethanolamine utilization protein EutQ (cupin superfamily)